VEHAYFTPRQDMTHHLPSLLAAYLSGSHQPPFCRQRLRARFDLSEKTMSAPDITWFRGNIHPHLTGFNITYTDEGRGDFGELQRASVEGNNKFATIDFWSSGWTSVDIFDCQEDAQTMNEMIPPAEAHRVNELLSLMIDRLRAGLS
jgi:hypothetical protein